MKTKNLDKMRPKKTKKWQIMTKKLQNFDLKNAPNFDPNELKWINCNFLLFF